MRNTEIRYQNKIREFRKANCLTQGELAEKLGFKTKERISLWEKGTMVPHLVNAAKLCKILGVGLEELYPGIGSLDEEEKIVFIQTGCPS